jgi:hypothetical protein
LDCSSKQNITKNQEYTTPNSSTANDTPRRRLSGINSSKTSDTPRRRLSEINSSLIEILDDIRSSPLAPTCQRDGKAFIAAHSECQATPLPVLTSVASCQTDFLLETKDASTQTDFEYNCEPSNDASCQTENFPCGNCDSSPLCDPSLPSLLVLKKKLEFITNEISTFIDLRGNIIKNTLKSVNTNQQIANLKPIAIQSRSNNSQHMNINEASVNSKMNLIGDLVPEVSDNLNENSFNIPIQRSVTI